MSDLPAPEESEEEERPEDLSGRRRVKVRKRRSRQKKTVIKKKSPEWDRKGEGKAVGKESRWIVVGGLVLFVALGMAWWWFARHSAAPSETSAPLSKGAVPPPIFSENPGLVALRFGKAATVAERLKFVRNPGEVRARLGSYPEEALSEPVLRTNALKGKRRDSVINASFVAILENGERRLLSVVPTPEGPKVDWDAYARFSTATWDEILAGKAESAEVRVTIRKSGYYNFTFRDDKKWQAFEISAPELEDPVYLYTPKRSNVAVAARSSTGGNQAARVIVRISRDPAGIPRRQFLLDEFVADGWVKPD